MVRQPYGGNEWTGEHTFLDFFYAAAPLVLHGWSSTLPSLLYVFNQYFCTLNDTQLCHFYKKKWRLIIPRKYVYMI